MNTSKGKGFGQRRSSGIALRVAGYVIIVGMLAGSSAAFAGTKVAPTSQPASRAASTAATTAGDPYILDTGFNGGRFSLDHFFAAQSLDQVGLVNAKLANGDMVVAGLVPDGVSGGNCSDGNKLCSIGLVRYTPTGQRVLWPNAGQYGSKSNNYVVYSTNPTNTFQYLRDIKVRGNLIDVLVDTPDAIHTQLTLGYHNVQIITFRDDGSLVGLRTVFGSAGIYNLNDDNTDFYGAQMAQLSSSVMIVAATAYDSDGSHIVVSRLTIHADGTLTNDSGFGVQYAGGSYFYDYVGPLGTCGLITQHCDTTAGYVVKPVSNGVSLIYPDFYITGSLRVSNGHWNVTTAKISSATGYAKSEFNGGWAVTSYNEPGSTMNDYAAGLYVYEDDVYVAAQVAQKCQDSIGLVKLDGATGGVNANFGTSGKIVLGGQGNNPICFSFGYAIDVPYAITATGGRIGIAGYKGYESSAGPYNVDPMLAVVNAGTGDVLSFDFYTLKRADGTRSGDGILFGIYGGPSPTSPFTVSGMGRDTNAGNTLSYVAGRLIPLSGDPIFADGFDSAGW